MDTSRRVVCGSLAQIVLVALVAIASAVPVFPQVRERIVAVRSYYIPVAATRSERDMLDMINRERNSRGLPALVMDPELILLARAHSRDMVTRSYFSHNTPEGISPFDRFVAAGIDFRAAGENLALAPTVSIAHTGLMRSREHRENILHSSFGRIGIGIIDDGPKGVMISQEFRD